MLRKLEKKGIRVREAFYSDKDHYSDHECKTKMLSFLIAFFCSKGRRLVKKSRSGTLSLTGDKLIPIYLSSYFYFKARGLF
jgi:hypothetical protein